MLVCVYARKVCVCESAYASTMHIDLRVLLCHLLSIALPETNIVIRQRQGWRTGGGKHFNGKIEATHARVDTHTRTVACRSTRRGKRGGGGGGEEN